MFLLYLGSGFCLNLQPDKGFLERDKGIYLHRFRDVHWSSNQWREERALTFALMNSGERMTAKVQVLLHCRAHHLCFGLTPQTDCLMHEKDPSLCSEGSCSVSVSSGWQSCSDCILCSWGEALGSSTHTHTHTHTHTKRLVENSGLEFKWTYNRAGWGLWPLLVDSNASSPLSLRHLKKSNLTFHVGSWEIWAYKQNMWFKVKQVNKTPGAKVISNICGHQLPFLNDLRTFICISSFLNINFLKEYSSKNWTSCHLFVRLHAVPNP